ncbi:DNL-type zinc finger protein isoform X2 [Lagopus muta]|uniref:DNL-type zinc finger protein isoform X2 n=1 Tax=Lagopus muta TaxID=64668 RepID=UPI0020A0559F|nr:DNL-type zinc finger protein isoform X2 [Lagopus muta]XP_048821702.1 DNL-type zinc finger protein isoform X2 [Lagopus muta]
MELRCDGDQQCPSLEQQSRLGRLLWRASGSCLAPDWNSQCWAAKSQQLPPRGLRALPACWRSWLGQEQHEAQERVEVQARWVYTWLCTFSCLISAVCPVPGSRQRLSPALWAAERTKLMKMFQERIQNNLCRLMTQM